MRLSHMRASGDQVVNINRWIVTKYYLELILESGKTGWELHKTSAKMFQCLNIPNCMWMNQFIY